jgi:hypothetical protein
MPMNVLSAPKEREAAAQHDSDERGQRAEHGRIVRAAGFEWQPECRAVAGLSSTDERRGGWENVSRTNADE